MKPNGTFTKAIKNLLAVIMASALIANAQGVESTGSVQTLFGDGTRGFNDGVWTNAQIYNPVAYLEIGTALVFFDDRQDFLQVPIRTFSNEDRMVITGSNSIVQPRPQFSHSYFTGGAVWLTAGRTLVKQSMKEGVIDSILFNCVVELRGFKPCSL